MQTLIREVTGGASRLRDRWGFSALAVLLLSLGIGATTAAFSIIDGFAPHSAHYPSCDIAASYAADSVAVIVDGPSGEPDLRGRVSGVYEASMDAAGSSVESWVEMADAIAGKSLLVMLSAAALALLVACSNSARVLYERSGRALQRSSTARVALASVGALSVAALLLRLLAAPVASGVFGLIPAVRLDARAIGFAICVSAVVEARRRVHPRLT